MSQLDSPTVPLGGPTLPQERRLVTSIPGPRSQELMARKAAAVSAGVGHTAPLSIVAAGGGILLDADGNSIVDLGSGIAVTSIGNAHPAVVAAVQQQVGQFTHTCFMVAPYEPYVAVAEALNRITPGDHEKKTALFNSGAEAVENAVKIARKHTGRQAVVAFDHGYHGRTNLTMALTAKHMPYKAGFGPFAPEIYRAPMSYPYRDGLDGAAAAKRAIGVIEKHVGVTDVAAIIIEPIQGEGGFIVPADGFLPALQEWANANGVVLIADEIQTGFARTGAMFASDLFGIVPDLITTAKGIAGGLPLAAVTGAAALEGQGGYEADASVKASSIVVDFITPETETSHWYFWGMARQFAVDDAAITDSIRQGQAQIFGEDLAMLEQQQRNLLRCPDRRLLKLNIDAGGVRSRLMIERAIAQENVAPAPLQAAAG